MFSLLNQPQAIVFDWDNTLVDTLEHIYQALNHTCSHLNHPLMTKKEVQDSPHGSAKDTFPILFPTQHEQAMQCFYDYVNANHMKDLSPFPDVSKLLKTLHQQEIPMAIVSNKDRQILIKEINHLGWKDYFSVIIASSDAQRDKPHPDPLLMALRELHIAPSTDVWFFGDSPLDRACAESAGCHFFSTLEYEKWITDLLEVVLKKSN